MDVKVHQLLDHGQRHRAALTYRSDTLSYRELSEMTHQLAGGFRGVGLGRGERLAIYMEKRLETVTSMFAASRVGAVFVPINPVLRPRQVAFVLADGAVSVLVTSAQRWASIAEFAEGLPALRTVLIVDADTAQVADDGDGRVIAWNDLADASPPPIRGTDRDLAAIFYTSGSTGPPKGVMLSHRNIVVGAHSVAGYLHNVADDVILALLPLSFDAGFSQLTTGFHAGAHVVLHNFVLPMDVVTLCAEHQVTGLTCVPPLFAQLANAAWPDEATASVRYFASTGGRMPVNLLARLRTIWPVAQPFLMYGLTEAFRSTYLDPSQVDRRPESIGTAIPNAEILVVRPDGSLCDPGEEGELVHCGPLVSLGYWNDPDRTANRFKPRPGQHLPGGHTIEMAVFSGDRVRADDDGYLYFVARADEMIKSSGYRISPTEIEDAAQATEMVGEAVALGIPDEVLGHRVGLAVTSTEPNFDVGRFKTAIARELPRFMLPAVIVVRPTLPRSANGKYDRAAILELMENSA